MGTAFWVRRFLLALLVASSLLTVVHYAKGNPLPGAARFGVLWGAISAMLFTLIGYVRYRRNPACMLPRHRRD